MKHVTIYEPATGRIVCCYACPNTQLPRQGQVPFDDTYVLHGKSDPDTDRVEHGRIVPKGLQDKRRAQRQAQWVEFRQERAARFASTDHKLAEDFPLSAAERRELKAKRKASRDIPQKTSDPVAALRLLRTIWNGAEGGT